MSYKWSQPMTEEDYESYEIDKSKYRPEGEYSYLEAERRDSDIYGGLAYYAKRRTK